MATALAATHRIEADAVTARLTAVAVTARLTAVAATSVGVGTVMAATHRIGVVAATALISALAVTADAVTARLAAVAATLATTLPAAVVAVDSVLAATVLAATALAATHRMVAAASVMRVMAVGRSLITAVAVRLASAMPDTAVAVGVDTLMRDSLAVDINRTVVGAASPASIAGKVGAVSPITIRWLPDGDTESTGIAANVSRAEL
ncbi:MAG: hypothetical protein ACRELG_09860 [Gemmataceae bacterium]